MLNTVEMFVLSLGAAVMIPLLINFLSTSYIADSARRFFWADRDLSGLLCGSLISSTAFAMNGVLYFLWLGYWIGFSALLLQIFWCASYLWVRRYADTIQNEAQHGTLHGILGNRFGRYVGVTAAVASILGFLITLGWEVTIATSMFKVISESKVALAGIALLFALAAAIYTSLGGLRGNVRANFVQNILGALALMLLVFFLIPDIGSFFSLVGNTEGKAWTAFIYEFGFFAILSNILFSLLFQFVDMSVWQSLAATKSDHHAGKIGLWISAVFVFGFPGLLGTLAGIALRSFGEMTDTNIVDRTIEILGSNPWIAAIVLIGFFSATLSTLDGLLLSASQATTWDLLFKRMSQSVLAGWQRGDQSTSQPNEPISDSRAERRLVGVARLLLPLLAVVGTSLALWLGKYINLFDLIYVAFSAQLALFPLIYRLVTSPGDKDTYGVLTIVAGLLAGLGVVAYTIGAEQTGYAQYAPIATLLVGYIVYKLEQAHSRKTKLTSVTS